MAPRNEKGHFLKGSSGNPGGRPAIPEELKAAARGLSMRALGVLEEALSDDDPRVRIVAANSILERAYGKPAAAEKPEGGATNSQAHITALIALADHTIELKALPVLPKGQETPPD